MKVQNVEKARKSPGKCGRCAVEIQAGEPYRFAASRFAAKKVRCMAVDCAFRQSELETSDKLSRAYAAQEAAEDYLAAWNAKDDGLDGLKEALTAMADELREVAGEYQESADNIRDRFSESETADQCEEKAQGLEEWADEVENALDSHSSDDFEVDQEDPKHAAANQNEDGETLEEWADALRTEANDAIQNCPL